MAWPQTILPLGAMSLQQTLGKNIRHWRRVRGLSQEEFAHRAQLHPTYVSGIERGHKNPTVSVIERIAAALTVGPDVLLLSDAAQPEEG